MTYFINEKSSISTHMNLQKGIWIVCSKEKLHLDQESYFQEINYRIKILGSLWYDWGNELIVVSQNLNSYGLILLSTSFKEVFHNRKIK